MKMHFGQIQSKKDRQAEMKKKEAETPRMNSTLEERKGGGKKEKFP